MPTPAWQKMAALEYIGIPGATQDCVDAVIRLLQCRVDLPRTRILSASNEHALLLTTAIGDLVAVKSGFASGYGGTGPHGFSYVLQLLEEHGSEIDEYKVSRQLIDRLDYSALTARDLRRIENAHPLRPRRWHRYILESHWQQAGGGTLWRDWPPLIPLGLVDPRIADLAKTFWEDPDARLLTGYRRLEDIVRKRTGGTEHGSKLFSEVFLVDPPKLTWKDIASVEHKGRAQLFTATYMAYRNRRAHRETDITTVDHTEEFLLLNHLYKLEGAAEPS